MKYYNKCKGCGLVLQTTKENNPGFVPNNKSPICRACFRSKNYGEFDNNLSTFYKIDEIKEISKDNVLMVVDILNPYETFIKDINKYVQKKYLTILVNKVDILPKSISDESIIEWIDKISKDKGIEFSNLALISASKKTNIDSVSSFILNSDRNTSIIGYSNVGKSSIIISLFESLGLKINNLITNSIGT
ncbi:MAG: hypothetical protein HRS50_02370, partial [Mycoplasmataceae bacterium]|nr:hypothetical protein [Mycoplasmataceae bacterium]